MTAIDNKYVSAVEDALMRADVEEGLELRDVKFTGEAILDGGEVFLETHIIDSDGRVETFWVALFSRSELIFLETFPDDSVLSDTEGV